MFNHSSIQSIMKTAPKTDTLLTLSRTVKEKGEMKIYKETELAQVNAKQYLDRVENTTRKAVFLESSFKVRVSFCPIFSMNLKTILIS